MKAKRILALFMSCLLSLSLFACGGDDTNDTEASSDTGAQTSDTEEQKTIVTKAYPLTDILDCIKIFGRTSVLSTGLTCDHASSGIEFNAYIEGTLTLGITVSADCYFTLYIDGVRSEERLMVTSADTSLELARFETGGVHNIRLIKQTESKNALSVLSTLTFTGYFEQAPADREYYIEFLGDSISSGYGNLITGGTAAEAQLAVNQDATQTYAYLAAQRLVADHSVVSVSGIGVVQGFRDFTMSDMFDASSYYRSQTVKYQPTRTPDLIVINLGTNDEIKGVNVNEWQAGVSALILQVRMTYGENVPIVWVYGMMRASTGYLPYTQSALDEFGGEAGGVYLCALSRNTAGGGGHPDLQAHATASEELARFIQDKNILK